MPDCMVAKRLKTRDEFLSTEDGREVIAMGLILYAQLRRHAGVDWIEAAQEQIHVAQIMGVSKDLEKLLPIVPTAKFET